MADELTLKIDNLNKEIAKIASERNAATAHADLLQAKARDIAMIAETGLDILYGTDGYYPPQEWHNGVASGPGPEEPSIRILRRIYNAAQ